MSEECQGGKVAGLREGVGIRTTFVSVFFTEYESLRKQEGKMHLMVKELGNILHSLFPRHLRDLYN